MQCPNCEAEEQVVSQKIARTATDTVGDRSTIVQVKSDRKKTHCTCSVCGHGWVVGEELRIKPEKPANQPDE